MSKKFSRAILHFGADKTGSTSIQLALDSLRQRFLSLGLLAYPPGIWHAQLGSCFCETPESYIFNQLNGLRNRDAIVKSDRRYMSDLVGWLNSVPKCERLLFSYEGFTDLNHSALIKLRDFCLSWADEVSIFMYVRPPLSYALSGMSQRVKVGDRSWSEAGPPIWPYSSRLKRVIDVFGKENTTVELFTTRSLKDGDVVADFFSSIEINQTDVQLQGRMEGNETLTESGLIFGDALIAHLDEVGCKYANGEFHRKFGQYLTAIPGPKISLSEAQAEEILLASKKHSLFLKQNFGINFKESKTSYLPSDAASSIPKAVFDGFASFFANIVRDFTRVWDGRGSLICNSRCGDLLIEEELCLPLVLANKSFQSWVGSNAYPIALSYQWMNELGNLLPYGGGRTALPEGRLGANESVAVLLAVQAPPIPGEFKLRILPLQERVCWFDEVGFSTLEIDLRIVRKEDARRLPACDLRFHSSVGNVEGGQRVTNGKEGYLLFGPYTKVSAGKWSVTLHGVFSPNGEVIRADVAAQKGNLIISRIAIKEHCSAIQMSFQLDTNVTDIEVRLWVHSRAQVTIDTVYIAPQQLNED